MVRFMLILAVGGLAALVGWASIAPLTERVAELDAELGRGLGDFDEMLLREQERIKVVV